MATSKSRAYDSLYDPSYTVSGARDHYREQSKANGLYVERVPDYSNFFSELRTHPSSSYRFKLNDKIPQHVPREYEPLMRTRAEIADASRPHEVSGANRYKYFRRPLLVPIAGLGTSPDQTAPLPLGEDSATMGKHPSGDVDAPPGVSERHEHYGGLVSGEVGGMSGLSRTVATQSDYRESETQTIAYEPDYVLPEQASLKQRVLDEKLHLHGLPEALIMKDLGIVTGLTPGVAEVEALERARAKRAFESRLPPLNDMSKMGLRQRMMNTWEHHEMEMRDEELKRLQEERLSILADALARREGAREAMTAKRIDAKCEAMIATKEKVFASIQTRRVKAIRKLATKRARAHASFLGHEHSKDNIIENYNNFGSKVYAPLSRVGFCPDNSHNMVGFEADITDAGLEKMLGATKKTEEESMLRRGISSTKSRAGLTREEHVVQSQISYISGLLDDSKAAASGQRGYGSCWPQPMPASGMPQDATRSAEAMSQTKSHRKSERRPETPSSFAPDRAADLERHRAVVLLQRLLRGRADQMERYDGKERRRELIHELRITPGNDSSSVLAPNVDAIVQDDKARNLEVERIVAREMSRMMRVLSDPDPITRMEALSETLFLRERLEEERRHEAAMKLQAAERGRKARSRVRALRAQREAEEHSLAETVAVDMVSRIIAAASLEASLLAKKEDDGITDEMIIDGVLSLLVDDAVGDDANVFDEDSMREDGRRQAEAAVLIQKVQRGRAARRKYELMKERAALLAKLTEEDEAKIVKVQASIRGYQQRKRFHAQRRERARLELEASAALKIQSVQRGRVARREFAAVKKKADLIKSAEDEAKRRHRELEALTNDMSEEEVQKVVKLQAHVRGRIVRGQQHQQELQQKQATPSSSASGAASSLTPARRKSVKDPDMLDEEIAVLKIQSAIRGRLARKEAERRRENLRKNAS